MKRRVMAAMLSLAMAAVTAVPSALPVYAEENSGIAQEMRAGEEDTLIVAEETQEVSAAESTSVDVEPQAQDAADDISLSDGAVIVVSQEEISEPAEENAPVNAADIMDASGNTDTVEITDAADTAAGGNADITANQPMPITIAQADISRLSVTVTGDSGSSDTFSDFTTDESTLTQKAACATIHFDPASAGKDQKLPEIAVTYEKGTEEAAGQSSGGTVTLKADQDYTVSGANLKNAANADAPNAPALTLKFFGEYENLGDIIIKFGITPASLEGAAVSFDGKPAAGDWTVPYDGREHVPANVSVILGEGAGQAVLSEKVDYEITDGDAYPNKRDAGEYSFSIAGINNYTGSITVTYKIEKADAEGNVGQADLGGRVFYDVAKEPLEFSAVEAAITEGVKNTLDSSDVLEKGKDYELVCYKTDGSAADTEDEKKEAGVHKYEIKIKGECKNFEEGTGATGTYEIKKEWPLKKVTECQETAIRQAVSGVTYTGQSLNEDMIGKITAALEEYGSDSQYKGKFNVAYGGGDIVDCGVYTFTVSGAADSPWKEDQPAEISGVEVMPKEMAASGTALSAGFEKNVMQKCYADGSADAPKLTLKDNGKELKEGTDYICDLGYDESRRNVVTTAKIRGRGNYRTTVNGSEGEVKLALPEISKVIDLADETIRAEVTANFSYNPEELTLKAGDITVTQDIPGRKEPYRIDASNYFISWTDYGTGEGQSKKAGLHHVTIEAKQNTGYKGKIEKIEFTVEGIDIDTHYELNPGKLDGLQIEFDSEVSCPAPAVVAKGTDKLLNTENYKLSYYKMKGTEKVYVGNEDGTTLFTVGGRMTFPEPGTYTIEVIPDPEKFEMYMGTLECTIEILAKSIKPDRFTVECPKEITWPGHAVTDADLAVTLEEDGKTLIRNTDFTVKVSDGDKTGETTVTITGIGNYRESRTEKLTIKKQSLSGATVAYAKESIPYCSDITKALDTGDVTVKLGEKAIDPLEYTVGCVRDAGDPGKATILVTAISDGHYSDSASAAVSADTEADISKTDRFELQGFEPVLYFHKGETEVKQEKLILRDKTLKIELKAGSDYEVTYENAAPGNDSTILIAAMTITGIKNAAGFGYYGTITKHYTITLPFLKTVTVAAGQDLTYTGIPILPKVAVTDVTGKAVPESAYDISGENNQNAGTATVVVTAKENSGYTGFAKTSFTITKAENKVTASVSPEKIKIGETAKVSASAKGGAVFTYTSSSGAVAAVSGDGTVTGKAAGTAEITVGAAQTDNYKAAEKKITVVVVKKENSVSVTGAPSDMEVDGSTKVAAAAAGGAKLTYASNNTAVASVSADGVVTAKAEGTAVITVSAAETDEYAAASAAFTVKVTKPQPQPQTEAQAPKKSTNKINASNVKKAFSAKKRSFKLKVKTTYKAPLTYVSSKSAVKVSNAGKVTVKAGFVGEAKITITAAETDLCQAAVKTILVRVTPKKTRLKKVVSSNGMMKLKWIKSPGATGYQIQYSQHKSYDKGKIITVRGADSAEKALKKGETYYVRIRVFKAVSGKRLYSKWSKGQRVEIK